MERETHKCLQLQRQQMQHAKKREETGAEVNMFSRKKERVSEVIRTFETKMQRDHKQICKKVEQRQMSEKTLGWSNFLKIVEEKVTSIHLYVANLIVDLNRTLS